MVEKNNQLKITDTTLRDAHQSLWATRMRTEDILPICGKIDEVGYHSMEVWGGATFDVCLRFLNEDPWLRLREIKKRVKKTPLQMLLRGQNIVGYKNYSDDVLEAFIKKACEGGIDIFRIFDALNDIRNLEKCIRIILKEGSRAQGSICYTRSPIHTIEMYVEFGKRLVDAGATSINIKDMSGILTPYTAYELVSSLKSEIKIPIQIHCHSSSGMATAAYVKAAEAGVDIIDCAAAPLALYTSQPACATMVAIMRNTPRAFDLDFKVLHRISEYFEDIAEKRRLDRKHQNLIDVSVIEHQVPGGMVSNMIIQLEQQNALNRFEEVLLEIPKVRKEFGWPPLVTPMSQIVGTQAVFNVISGKRYKIVPNEVKDYLMGYYGTPPGEISDEVLKIIGIKEKKISCRPADLLDPMMERATDWLTKKGLNRSEEDVITYAIFPDVAVDFFTKREKNIGPTTEMVEKEASPQISNLAQIFKSLDNTSLTEFSWIDKERKITIRKDPSKKSTQPAQKSETTIQEQVIEQIDLKHDTIYSPIVGIFYLGDPVPLAAKGEIFEEHHTIGIIEAMRIKNEIKSKSRCRIVDILVKDKEPVEYGQPLFVVEHINPQ